MSLVPRSSVLSTQWQTILTTPQALVLYNPTEHSLTVLPQSRPPRQPPESDDTASLPTELEQGGSSLGGRDGRASISFADDVDQPESVGGDGGRCPTCGRTYHGPTPAYFSAGEDQQAQHARYFDLLSRANTPIPSGRASPAASSTSRIKRFFSPSAPASGDEEDDDDRQPSSSTRPSMAGARASSSSSSSETNSGADGYYGRFFVERQRLGMGAYGSVFLCEHVLDGQPLGLYAVKKVAVGKDKPYRRSVLREVEVLKGLRHDNIITYHHAWIEKARFSSFGPYIDSLHILMQYAPLGSLEDYLAERSGTSGGTAGAGGPDVKRSGQRVDDVKAAFRARRGSQKPVERGERRGVRLMGKAEIEVIFGGIVRGLGYLHNHDLLHLDLKCSNVLLHIDESDGDLIPRPLISDFGTTRQVVYFPRDGESGRRTGNTGTLEYCAPENVELNAGRGDIGKESDHWALGLILHKLLFYRLPYSQVEDLEILAAEILAYPGFIPTPALFEALDRRGLPRFYLWILSSLLNLDMRKRIGCRLIDDILKYGIREESHQHYPFETQTASTAQATARVYEQTDAEHSLAPYVPRTAFLRDDVVDDEVTVTTVEPTPSGSFSDLRGLVGPTTREPLTQATTSAKLPSFTEEKGPLRLLPSTRILLSPPSAQPRFASSASAGPDLSHASIVLLKFLSLHMLLAGVGGPTISAQLAVLALALASRGSFRNELVGVGAHVVLLGALFLWSTAAETTAGGPL